jgi:hypothetical protein
LRPHDRDCFLAVLRAMTFSGLPVPVAAAMAGTEIAAGRYRGPLHGMPLGIKDFFWTDGVATTGGMTIHRDFVPNVGQPVPAHSGQKPSSRNDCFDLQATPAPAPLAHIAAAGEIVTGPGKQILI